MGPKKFLFYYIVCGVGAGLCQELAQYGTYLVEGLAHFDSVRIGTTVLPMDVYLNMMNTVGASGAIYGVLLAFGMLFPEERMFIIPIPIPIKAKWIVMGSIVVELFSAIGTSNDGVAHLAHLGGMLFGFILIRYWKKHPYSGYGDFGMNRGHQFFDRMKNTWEQRGGVILVMLRMATVGLGRTLLRAIMLIIEVIGITMPRETTARRS